MHNLRTSGGNITKSAEAAGITRQGVHYWRQTDPEFAEAWDDSIEAGTENLEENAYNRAIKSSDLLTIFLLKARRPEKYRENIRVETDAVDPKSLAAAIIAECVAQSQRLMGQQNSELQIGSGTTSGIGDE